jgi:regulator of protease activity HflC (stomatin/prohibitin superfamily)
MITRSQLQSADRLAQANRDSEERRALAEQHVKILEIFSDQIKSGEPAKRKIALRVLTALEPELAGKLAQAVADTDSDPDIRKVADSVVRSVSSRGNTTPSTELQMVN